jgi:hypothetical protein
MAVTDQQIEQLLGALINNATGPAASSDEVGSFSAKNVAELVEAIKFVASMRASGNPARNLRITQMRPAGAVFSHNDLPPQDFSPLDPFRRIT